MMLADDVEEMAASGILELGSEDLLVAGTGAAQEVREARGIAEAGWLPYWASSSDLRIKGKSVRIRAGGQGHLAAVYNL